MSDGHADHDVSELVSFIFWFIAIMIFLSTWMYVESQSDGGLYAQIGGAATSSAKQMIYWRCVVLFFALASRHLAHRSDVRLCFFTNQDQLPDVEGLDLQQILTSLGVEIIYRDYTWRPTFPNKNWYNQFYVFDIFEHFVSRVGPDDHIIVADSDCLVVSDLDAMFDVFMRDGILAIDVKTAPDEDINGISRRQAAALYGTIGGIRQPLVAPYFGGEFIGISSRNLSSFLEISRNAFAFNNKRAQSGRPYLTEEAHLLSYACVQLGFEVQNANQFVRRIWTSWKSNNTRREDLNLSIWHVPAEKQFGIKKLTKELVRSVRRQAVSQLNMQSVDLDRTRLGQILGVGKKRISKYATTLGFALIRKLARILGISI